jgi:hypothetical protein
MSGDCSEKEELERIRDEQQSLADRGIPPVDRRNDVVNSINRAIKAFDTPATNRNGTPSYREQLGNIFQQLMEIARKKRNRLGNRRVNYFRRCNNE